MKLPHKLELTWIEKQQRWVKKIPVELRAKFGKQQFFISQRDCGLSDKQWTREKSYSAALQFWHDAVKKAEAEPVPVVPSLIRLPTGEIVPIEEGNRLLKAASQMVDWGNVDAIGKVQLINVIRGNPEAIKEPQADDIDRSIMVHVEAYRTKCRNDVANATIKPGRFVKIDNSLNWLLKFANSEWESSQIDSLKADFLDAYFGWLNKKYKVEKVLACASIRDHWQVFTKFVEWLYENHLIELPRNFNNKKFSIVCPKVKYRYWTREEFDRVYQPEIEKDSRLKLYLLLTANCGFYASDIANIKKSELNLKAGTITRQRTKTGDDIDEDKYEPASNVPVVTYYLWPETLKLLKMYLSDDPVFALLNEDGGPLWVDGIRPKGHPKEGQYFKNNNIQNVYFRFNKANKIEDAPTFEMLRKSSAQLISTSQHAKCANMFGGWAERETRTKHYTEVTNAEFKACLMWLRTQYISEE